jgi:predicted N-acetyltransferase YhbS
MTMPTSTSLRPASPGDAARIAKLLTDEGYPAGPSDIVERLERFAGHDGVVLVAEAGGEAVGFVAAHLVPRFEHDDQVLRILALVVDPGIRDRGVGRQLMDAMEATTPRSPPTSASGSEPLGLIVRGAATSVRRGPAPRSAAALPRAPGG